MHAKSPFMAGVAAALLVSTSGSAGAWSLFGSEKRDLLDHAEEQFALAAEARKDGRVLDEYDALLFAVRDYGRLATEFPDYRADSVKERGAAVHARLAELTEGIRNGTIAVPDPDEAVSGGAAERTLAAGEIPPVREVAPEGDFVPGAGGGDRYPTPDLVVTKPAGAGDPAGESPPPAASPAAGEETSGGAPGEVPDLEKLARLEAPIPNPFFYPETEFHTDTAPARAPEPNLAPEPSAAPAVANAPAPTPEPPPAPEPSAAPAVANAPAPAPEPPPAPEPSDAPGVANAPAPAPEPSAASASREDHANKIRALGAMVKSGQASDAVILLEDLLEAITDETEATAARVLLARALLECRNTPRAAAELAALPESAAADPSVRSLRAAVAVAQGRFPEAILQLHLLVAENPGWADAWVDLAWANFLMDPAANRISSISYYQNALTRGARRDMDLERRLRVKIGVDATSGGADARP